MQWPFVENETTISDSGCGVAIRVRITDQSRARVVPDKASLVRTTKLFGSNTGVFVPI